MVYDYSVTKDDIVQTKNLVFTRLICSMISLVCCVFIMIIYFILWIQYIHSNWKIKQMLNDTNSSLNSSYQKSDSSNETIKKKATQKSFGLGSHAMFLLLFCNSLWCINSIHAFVILMDSYSF